LFYTVPDVSELYRSRNIGLKGTLIYESFSNEPIQGSLWAKEQRLLKVVPYVFGRHPIDTSAGGFHMLLEPLHHGTLY
jgi:hypothetical protein